MNEGMDYFLCCHERVDLRVGIGLSRLIEVVDSSGQCVEKFELMCAAIDSDVRTSATTDWIAKVEAGELDSMEVDGNGWVIHISLNEVSFRGLYEQGEGGDVSIEQFKFAVETFLQFLSDSSLAPIRVNLPG